VKVKQVEMGNLSMKKRATSSDILRKVMEISNNNFFTKTRFFRESLRSSSEGGSLQGNQSSRIKK